MARNGRPNQRTLGGCPVTSPFLNLKIRNLQGSEEDASTPDSPHWSGEMVVGDYFSCFLLEDDGSSSVGSIAAIGTQLKGSKMRRGAQSEPLL